MATILSFVPAAKKSSANVPRQRRSDAAIIIFPGVRYEQQPDMGPEDDSGGNQPKSVGRRVTKR
ncbi:hypothetical protein [Nitratireductor sp. PBL-C9]|uniref:hypothetical protein n=1 Tax=Nitratireductor sp. PBL-C9 TaxID=3435013 RepID=UPI003D7E704D